MKKQLLFLLVFTIMQACANNYDLLLKMMNEPKPTTEELRSLDIKEINKALTIVNTKFISLVNKNSTKAKKYRSLLRKYFDKYDSLSDKTISKEDYINKKMFKKSLTRKLTDKILNKTAKKMDISRRKLIVILYASKNNNATFEQCDCGCALGVKSINL